MLLLLLAGLLILLLLLLGALPLTYPSHELLFCGYEQSHRVLPYCCCWL